MRVELIEERTYTEQMNETVIPTLAKCCTAGWMEPAQGDGLSDVSSSGKLHYLCYDAKRFDELNVTGAVAQFRGAIVISHGFTEFAEKYTELIWYFLLEGTPYACLNIAVMAIRHGTSTILRWCGSTIIAVMSTIWPCSPRPSGDGMRAPTRSTSSRIRWAPASGSPSWRSIPPSSTKPCCPAPCSRRRPVCPTGSLGSSPT